MNRTGPEGPDSQAVAPSRAADALLREEPDEDEEDEEKDEGEDDNDDDGNDGYSE